MISRFAWAVGIALVAMASASPAAAAPGGTEWDTIPTGGGSPPVPESLPVSPRIGVNWTPTASVPDPAPACRMRPCRTFDLTIPVWIPGISGTFASGDTGVDIDRPDEDPIVNAPEIASEIEFAFMGAIDLGIHRWVVHADMFGVTVKDTAEFRVETADAKGTITGAASRLLVGYRVLYPCDDPCRTEVLLDAMAGARFCYARIELDEPQALSFDRDKFWVDPILAVRATFDLPGRIDFRAMADIGGFGVGSELSWSATVEAVWRISSRVSLSLGYTWLSLDYDIGDDDGRFVYDLDLRGPQLSLTFHF